MPGEVPLDWIGVAWRLGATLSFVLLNGFFVAAEFALVKVRPSQLATLAAAGSRRARVTEHVLRQLDHYLSACQLGITISSLVLGALGEPVVTKVLLSIVTALGFSVQPNDPVLHGVGLVVAFSLITVLHMTLGEQAPKMLALQRAQGIALATSLPLTVFAFIFRPFIWLVNEISNGLLRITGLTLESGFESSHTAEEIRHILSLSAQSGHITAREWELARNVFQIMEREVRHIMVPRVDVVYLSLQEPLERNLERMRKTGHSRFPLCEVGLDTIVGFVHVKDVFSATPPRDLDGLRRLARSPVFVPESMTVPDLILELQRQRSHIAVVLDEHGTANGLVFLEDAIEGIVGPLGDEFDEPARHAVRELGEGSFEMSGSVPLPEVQERLRVELEEATEDTIGGHVVAHLGRMPRRGDELVLAGYRVSVVEVGPRRIARLRFDRLPPEEGEEGEAAEGGPAERG